MPRKVEDVLQHRMRVAAFAHLHEQDAILESDRPPLKARVVPPFDREIELAPGDHDPERHRGSQDLLDLRKPRLLDRRDVNVAAKHGRPDGQAQLLVQEVDETMNEVVRRLVALVNERVLAIDDSTPASPSVSAVR